MRLRFALSLLVILFAAQVCAAQTTPAFKLPFKALRPSSRPVDLAIGVNGQLQGRVVDRQGKPLPGMHISLLNQHRLLETVASDVDGRFVFRDVQTGPKVIQANKQMQVVRVWDAMSVPPGATSQLLFVAGPRTVRAQGHAANFQGHFGGAFQRILQNPWLIGVGTAAAVAIPLATDDDDERADDYTNKLAAPGPGAADAS